jgi:hypothetical protein
VKAPVVVGHGISKAETFVKMVELCRNSVLSDYCGKVSDAFETLITETQKSTN